MFNQKGFAKITIVTIFFILIGTAYFVFSKNEKNIQFQNIENQNSQPDQSTVGYSSIDNWKTYRNYQYGFEFKYPTNLYKDGDSTGDKISLLKAEEGSINEVYGNQISINVDDLIYDNKKISKEEYIQKNFPENGFNGDGPGVKKWVNVNNTEMLKVEQFAPNDSNRYVISPDKSKHVLQYIYFRGGKVYTFYLYPYEPTIDYVSAKNYENFEKLVSTFRFTDNPSNSLIYFMLIYEFEFLFFLLPFVISLIISLFIVYKWKVINFWLFLTPVFLYIPIFTRTLIIEWGEPFGILEVVTVFQTGMLVIIAHFFIVAPYFFTNLIKKKLNNKSKIKF